MTTNRVIDYRPIIDKYGVSAGDSKNRLNLIQTCYINQGPPRKIRAWKKTGMWHEDFLDGKWDFSQSMVSLITRLID